MSVCATNSYFESVIVSKMLGDALMRQQEDFTNWIMKKCVSVKSVSNVTELLHSQSAM